MATIHARIEQDNGPRQFQTAELSRRAREGTLTREQCDEINRRGREGTLMAPFSPARRPSTRERARRETTAFIGRLDNWTHVVTLTFRTPVSEEDGQTLMWDWLKPIARRGLRRHFRVAWAVERGSERGRVHLHGLMAIQPGCHLDVRAARESWWARNGIIEIKPYVGIWQVDYLVKGDDWDWGVACPRRRGVCRTRCHLDSASR
jgi:hypothetical protein